MPSELYRRALADATAHHASSKTYSGKFLRPHKPFIAELIAELGIKSALDYGAGKGRQYEWVDPADGKTLEQAWGIEVAKYDPAWPPFANLPTGQFDLVICTHTLGSIPVKDMPWVLDRIFKKARKAVYFAEKIGLIRKRVHGDRVGFANGWNRDTWEHVILMGAIKADLANVLLSIVLSTTEIVNGERITTRAEI